MKDIQMPEALKKDVDKFNIVKMVAPVQRDSKDNVKITPTNAQLIIQHDEELAGLLAFNEFTQSIRVTRDMPALRMKKGAFNSVDLISISGYIERKHNIFFRKDILRDGVQLAASNNRFNPVLDRINAEEWDGVKRVETFFIDFLGAEDTRLNREIARKWLAGAIARALKPGVKFELMPVLIGGQGIGKSTLCNSLCPEYFLDNLPSLSGAQKDNLMLIKDNWIVEVAELSAMSKTAIDGTKAFISTRVDKYKAPYASEIDEHPRRCVFIGTTNETEFLKDKTGNRRFIPVQCGVQAATKDVFKITNEYILQVLAEARELYKAGENLFLDEETSKELEVTQEKNVVDDPLEEEIKDYLNMLVPYNWEEYNMFNRRNYFVKYYGNSEPSDKQGNKLRKSDLVPMETITTKEIIQAVLNITGRDVMSASRGNYGKKINLIMNSDKDFHKTENIFINGRRTRGWKRS